MFIITIIMIPALLVLMNPPDRIHIKRLIKKGEAISLDDFEFQRPCPSDTLKLNDFDKYLGKKIKVDLPKDEYLKYEFF